ncbi:hypothetical protein [Gimesia maris]|uniref:hypothetical protein n=1 Tax=Gimesia maris TaxID=122 RepID=UPI0032ED070B
MATVPKKVKHFEKRQSLTLSCREWCKVHDLLYALLVSPKLGGLRKRRGPENLERVKIAVEIIKSHTLDIAELEQVTISDTYWVMSQIPWVINEAASYRIGISSELVGNIYTQLQRKA